MAKSYTNRRNVRRIRVPKFRSLRVNILSNLAFGVMRGIGMALGFSGLAVVLIFLLKFLPLQDIPLIGDIVNAIIKGSGNS